MAMPVRDQFKYWGAAAVVLFVVLWVLGDVILPFVLAAAIAYILDPLADRLERLGLGRVWATAVITIALLLLFTTLSLLVVPTLVKQATELIATVPRIAETLIESLMERFPRAFEEEGPARRAVTNLAQTIQERGGTLLNQVVTSARSLIGLLALFVLVPVVAFYLLMDWDKMVARIDELLPREHAPTIRQICAEIDRVLAGFIRGQGLVALIIGVYYAIALMLAGLNFALVVGFTAGLMGFIPYLGSLLAGTLSIGLALVQFWGDWWQIAIIAVIYQVGQVVEGNILQPKIVGDSVGLHPVWLLFALAAFGTLFGFVGLLVAVPLAAALGVVFRFAIEQYKDSALYRGPQAERREPDRMAGE